MEKENIIRSLIRMDSITNKTESHKATCPECSGKMNEWSRCYLVMRWFIFIRKYYQTCTECKYTCSTDLVSGYWSGARDSLEMRQRVLTKDERKEGGRICDY